MKPSQTVQLLHKSSLWLGFLFILSILSACAPMENQAKGSQADYKETKSMVIDILRTEEGKKAIQEVLKEEETKQELILSEPIVQKTIQDTLLHPENKKKMQMMMADPKFRKEYAQQLEDENKKLIKDLMKDPDYRSSLMEVFKDPEMEKQFLELTKSAQFRQQTMGVMKEALESPYFRLELLELLSKVTMDMQNKGGQENSDGGREGDGGGSNSSGEGGGE